MWTRHFGTRPSHFYNIRGITGVEETKNTCEPVFSITNKTTAAVCCCHRTTPQGAKPLLKLTFIRPQQRFREVFGLKRPSTSVPNSFFASLSPKLSSPLLFQIKSNQNLYFPFHRGYIMMHSRYIDKLATLFIICTRPSRSVQEG